MNTEAIYPNSTRTLSRSLPHIIKPREAVKQKDLRCVMNGVQIKPEGDQGWISNGNTLKKEFILTAVRWYVAYPLSYKKVEEMLKERGLEVEHSTTQRWVVEYSPQLEKEFRKHKKAAGRNWRMDETYIKIKGVWHYLYRAVDKIGQTIDFYLSPHRDETSAKRFFQKSIRSSGKPERYL